jgi:trimeric autotransporter adhesin
MSKKPQITSIITPSDLKVLQGKDTNVLKGVILVDEFQAKTRNFYVDNVANRVGIRTNNPQAALDIVGDLIVSGTITSGGGGGSSLTVGPISNVSTADAADITSGVLTLHVADSSNPGIMSAEDQTFSGTKTFLQNINLAGPSTSTTGNVYKNSERFIHDFGTNNTFMGVGSGNYTMTGTGNTVVGTDSFTNDTVGTQNVAIGWQALKQNTSGDSNVAIGGSSVLFGNTIGSSNIAIGNSALASNISGNINIAIGTSALYTSTTGDSNIAIGNQTLTNSTVSELIAIGTNALKENTTGLRNTAVGTSALKNVLTGSNNTAIGHSALQNATIGDNTAVGSLALKTATTGDRNTAIGVSALENVSTGTSNVAVGYNALKTTTGGSNIAIGSLALLNAGLTFSNVAIGASTQFNTTTGQGNVGIGGSAMFENTTGASNIAIGVSALQNNDTGDNNIAIGDNAGSVIVGGDNNIHIANAGLIGDSGAIKIGTNGVQTTCAIQGISGATSADGVAVLVNASGELGTTTSSIRFKKDVTDIGDVSNKLYQLRPVSFKYINDEDENDQYGLIAEEVEYVFPELVAYKDKQPETVKYHLLTGLMLNEIQKLRKEVDELKANINK